MADDYSLNLAPIRPVVHTSRRIRPRIHLHRRPAMIIDCHGHYTTVPPEMEAYRKQQISDVEEARPLHKGTVPITDDQIRESLEGAQLKLQRERGADMTFFSPRASAMAHHLTSAEGNVYWAEHWNDL